MARPSCVRFDLLVVVIVGVALFSSSLAGRRKYRKNPYYLRDHNEKESEDDEQRGRNMASHITTPLSPTIVQVG